MARDLEADAEPRPALGIRDADLGARQQLDELRSRHQHADAEATNGSLYNRALVHPDYKDFGPRLGFAYSVTPKTVMRGGYGISYSFFNRPGSAQEGINAPQALFGLSTQSIPAGGAVPSTFLTTQNSFTTGIANPANFNPIVSNIDYIPANTRWPYIQSWFFSVQRELTQDTVLEVAYNGNHSLRLPIIADYNQALPESAGPDAGRAGAPADPELRRDHLARSGRQQRLQRLFRPPGTPLRQPAFTS